MSEAKEAIENAIERIIKLLEQENYENPERQEDKSNTILCADPDTGTYVAISVEAF